MLPSYSVKAGRFAVDSETKKVKPEKAKGRIVVAVNQDYETHFKWVDEDSKAEQLDLMVFANDAVFEPVPNKSNTYLLRFQTDPDKYFFWIQEKTTPEEVLQGINAVISFEPQDLEQEPQFEPSPLIEEEKPVPSDEPAPRPAKPVFNDDFIRRLADNLAKNTHSQESSITHLEKIFNYATISQIIADLSQEDKKELLQFLPEEQQQLELFADNVRSPQFLQALDVLSDALNSENALPLFMEMGLDQKYLQKYYGVHAFLAALVEKRKGSKNN